MGLNLAKVEKLISDDLKQNWPKLTFKIESDSEGIIFSNELSLNNLSNNILVQIAVFSECGTIFSAVFDHIEKTPKTLNLLNDFNKSSFFKATINNDEYLELTHTFICLKEEMFESYCTEFLLKLCDLNKDDTMRKLVSYTY